MSKTTQKNKLIKNNKLTNKENTNKTTNLLVNSNIFKSYGIPQLEKWKKILNKDNIEQNKTSNELTKRKKITKTNKKITRKNKKFLGIF
jgi:hypothetical protein